jgi:glutathione synthase/RimK-type ligase-like ATP-grasp enzyme
MAYGPYWQTGYRYALSENELSKVLELTDWAAERLGVIFPTIDVAKTASGEWIIIEVNDAQESGFVGVNPLILWNNTIESMQNRTWISAESF